MCHGGRCPEILMKTRSSMAGEQGGAIHGCGSEAVAMWRTVWGAKVDEDAIVLQLVRSSECWRQVMEPRIGYGPSCAPSSHHRSGALWRRSRESRRRTRKMHIDRFMLKCRHVKRSSADRRPHAKQAPHLHVFEADRMI
ncbi:hypothetical protein PINS_up010411 [Pythium insidiosum]|nr:hypothetical protein PINS_up010411 [Pythium insidiosum]